MGEGGGQANILVSREIFQIPYNYRNSFVNLEH